MTETISMKDFNTSKRLEITKNLDVKAYLEEIKRISEPGNFIPNEDQALLILHKARYFLGKQGHIDKRRMQDSKRWLANNGYKLPDV